MRGTRFMKQNRAETVQLLADYLRITPAQSARAYDPSTRAPVFAEGSCSGFRPTGALEGAGGLPVWLHALMHSFAADGAISYKGVNLDVQLTEERLRITKDIPLSQLVDWSLVWDLGKFRSEL